MAPGPWPVTVQPPGSAEVKDGGGLPRTMASAAATKKSKSGRPRCRQVATMVSSRYA